MNLSVVRSVFEHGLPERFPPWWPIHRLSVEFPAGIPVQGNHAPQHGGRYGVRDTAQTYIDACRMEVAIAATITSDGPPEPYAGVPMFVEVTAWIPAPSKLTRPEHLALQVALGGRGRGDGDKMSRFVWDALNAKAAGGAAWFADDSMIGEWSGRRLWAAPGQPPSIDVAVVPLCASEPSA